MYSHVHVQVYISDIVLNKLPAMVLNSKSQKSICSIPPPPQKNIIKKQKKNNQQQQRNKQTIKTLTTSSCQINSARVRGAKYCEQGLFTNIAFSFILLSQWSKSVLGSAACDNMESSVFTKVFTGLRRLFYAVSPSETSFPTVDEVPKYVDEVSCVIIFSFIEF